MTLRSMARECLLLVDHAQGNDEHAAQQRYQRPIQAFGGDERVGDQEDATRNPGIHQDTSLTWRRFRPEQSLRHDS